MKKRHQVSETCWFFMSVNHVFCFVLQMLIVVCLLFCLWCKFVLFVVCWWLHLIVIKHWVLSFVEEEEAELRMWVIQYYCWNWLLNCGTHGVVLLIFSFSFVDPVIQLKSAGEWIYLWNWCVNCYYVYMYVFIVCSLCVSSQEEDNGKEKEVWGWGWWWWREVAKKSTGRGKWK